MPQVSPQGTFLFDSIQEGNWYVMRPKQGLGARAIPTALTLIDSFNKREAPISAYAPRYRHQVSIGVFRERYVFHDIIFVHAHPDTMKLFEKIHPYQIFHVHDKSRHPDTNVDEFGRPTHDAYMRVTSRALASLYLSLNEYNEDVRVFTAEELQQLKYTRKVLIVDGPFKGRVCRIKTIQGKHRVIVDLVEGSMSLVILMPETHFQRI